jgi:hypothetical protein
MAGNPQKNVNGNWYWDETPHQTIPSDLIRYVLGLPLTFVNIGMKSIRELEINVAAALNKSGKFEKQIETVEKTFLRAFDVIPMPGHDNYFLNLL